jgi:nucleotide-binding universal stress UspA family protein
VLVPVDSATNVELVTSVAMTATPGAEIHIAHVAPTPEVHPDAAIRMVSLASRDARTISGYARLVGARGIVVDRHYGTSSLWRNTSVVARLARMSSVPVLALPAAGAALERWGAGNVSRVLAAVDSTRASAVALKTAISFAARHDARVTMLHALQGFPAGSFFSASKAWRLVQELPERQRAAARRLEARARHFGRADAVAHVITGDAASGILGAAGETDADVIVMGVPPRTRFERWVFGSTLERVLRGTEIPVLVVPATSSDIEPFEVTAFTAVLGVVDAGLATSQPAA